MRPEDWQAYQAGRAAPGAPSGGASPPPSSPLASRPPYQRAPRRTMGWPMAILLLGLAMIGGCCFSVAHMMDSISPSMKSLGAASPSLGVLVVENEITGSVWATNTIQRFADDPNIRAVVVRIDSPGGSVAPCQEIFKALKGLNKPVVVSMGSVAASGGLYIAAAGDAIYANPGTITGSIGVIMQSVEVGGAMEKLGLKSEVIKSGQYKDMGSPFRELRDSERALLQNMVTEVYEQFLTDLTIGRENKIDPAQLRRLADGRIYSGAEAHRLGLVDELGGFEEAVKHAARLGGLAPGRPEMVIEDGRVPWWQSVMESRSAVNISVPPALTPGFSMKYLYQPNLTN